MCISLIISHAGWGGSGGGDKLPKLASQSIKWHTPGSYTSNNLYKKMREITIKIWN